MTNFESIKMAPKMNLFLTGFLIFTSIGCASPSVSLPESQEKVVNPSFSNFTAKVIRIVDGDTLEVLYGELPVMIRLQHIDCPEKKGSQPYGKKAKETLSELCFGKNVQVKYSGDKDRNGRYICEIFTEDGLNINQEMVKRGMAWHYKKYSTDPTYSQLEKDARSQKVGLWADPNPVPPWEWRK